MTVHPGALEYFRGRVRAAADRTLKRPTTRGVVAFAEAERILLPENAAEPGPWRYQRTPYLREIAEAMTDPRVHRVVLMKPARCGFTEGIVVNGILYYVAERPSSVLVLMPTVDDGEKFSKEKLDPGFRGCAVADRLIPTLGSRRRNRTILNIEFSGGKIGIVGTNSPRMMRMRDMEKIFADEVDAYPPSSGDEGDPLALAEKRSANFYEPLLVVGSTPALKGLSRIEKAYEESDRRQWFVECPQCGLSQVLEFGGRDIAYGLKWASRRPETVFYLCRNACEIREADKFRMNERGVWRPRQEHTTRGYHMSALASNLPSARWAKLVQEWLEAQQDPEKLQVFVNTVLAETYELKGAKVEAAPLMARRERYPAEVPSPAAVITGMIDVQDTWVEVLLRAWGPGQESWRVLHERIDGDPDDPGLWETHVDPLLLKRYRHQLGVGLRPRCVLIDSGDRTATIYEVAKRRRHLGVFPSKGDHQDPKAPPVQRAKKPNQAGVKLVTLGTFTLKRRLFGRLKVSRPGPGYYHFNLPDPAEPVEAALREVLETEYFAQFEAEKLMEAKDSKGFKTLTYQKVRERNEAIDLEVGALAALYVCGPAIYDHLDREWGRLQRLAERGETPTDVAEAPAPAGAPRRGLPRRPPRWMDWRR